MLLHLKKRKVQKELAELSFEPSKFGTSLYSYMNNSVLTAINYRKREIENAKRESILNQSYKWINEYKLNKHRLNRARDYYERNYIIISQFSLEGYGFMQDQAKRISE